MSELTRWLSPETMRLLGLALVHFLWQGAALAALAYAAIALLRSAGARYVTAVAALALMMAAPAITFYVLHEGTVSGSAASAPAAMSMIAAKLGTVPRVSGFRAAQEPTPASSDTLVWLVQIWLAGVTLLSLRPVAGLLVMARIRQMETASVAAPLEERCRDLQKRLGLARVIRYCQTVRLEAPAVAGWLRPVVLLPMAALAGLSPQQLDAVIAHELAHIQRMDGLVNLFQIAAETLLFYHPAVWWLSQRIRAERENCCDDLAIAVCGDAAEYARALANMAEWQAAPALAMGANRGPLGARLARMLGLGKSSAALRSVGFAASLLCLSLSLVAGHAAFGLTRATAAAPWQEAPLSTLSAAQTTQGSSAKKPTPAARASATTAPKAAPTPEADESAQSQQPEPEPAKKTSYIDGLKAEGIDNLTVDELISLKVQGVTPEYVHRIHALGLKPSVDDLIALKVQGVTPEYITEMRAAGLTMDTEEIIGLKVQGVTPEYVKQMSELGIKANADDLVSMKAQGVTPEYIKSLAAAGLKLDAEDAAEAKSRGITPQFIEMVRSHGFKNLNLEKLIELKQAGVFE